MPYNQVGKKQLLKLRKSYLYRIHFVFMPTESLSSHCYTQTMAYGMKK